MIEIKKLIDTGDPFQQVVRLGTINSKTLGHLPEGAFREYAKKGCIYCAIENETVLGYILFAAVKSKRTLRIIHLCVGKQHRGKGIAIALLNRLKLDHSISFKGISLSCRQDYSRANEFWKEYGFKPKDQIRSRSKEEKYLIKWFYDFGNNDLFSIQDVPNSKTTALLDANIIIKLRELEPTDNTGSKYLLADWLVDDVDYYYAQEIFNEFQRDQDASRAAQSRSFLNKFYEAHFKPDENDEIFTELNNNISGESVNDQSDKRQLSECIAAGIEYFITTDSKILSNENYIFEIFGIQVMSPTDFIILKDEDNNKSAYSATRLSGVNYQYCRLRAGTIETLLTCFLRPEHGERKHNLRDLLTSLASNIDTCEVRTVHDKSNHLLGIWAAKQQLSHLEINVLRTNNTKLGATLFKQLAVEIIDFSRKVGLQKILINDPFLTPIEKETLDSLGFLQNDDGLVKLAIEGITTSDFILHQADVFNHLPTSRKQLIKNGAFAHDELLKFEIERMLWPAKFEDLDLPVYIIPIKPYWASQLFDYHIAASDLFGAKPTIAWNRENVYYRSVKPIEEKFPARILWYVSSSSNSLSERTSAIVATSYLDEVHCGPAKELFRKFKHYGVYEWKNILDLAKGDPSLIIKTLKFSDTEVFPKPIKLRTVHKVLEAKGQSKNTFASPVKTSTPIFLELYKIGTKLSNG